MKKIAACLLSAAMVLALTVSAAAAGLDANKQKIMDAVDQTITVNNKVVALSDVNKTQVENYLKRDDVTISDEQASTVVAQIDKALDVVKAAGVDNLDNLSAADQRKILDIADVAADAVGLKVVVNSATNTITVLDKNNTVVATIDAVIKVTGPDVRPAVAVIGLVLVLLAGCAVAAHKSKLAVQ